MTKFSLDIGINRNGTTLIVQATYAQAFHFKRPLLAQEQQLVMTRITEAGLKELLAAAIDQALKGER